MAHPSSLSYGWKPGLTNCIPNCRAPMTHPMDGSQGGGAFRGYFPYRYMPRLLFSPYPDPKPQPHRRTPGDARSDGLPQGPRSSV